MDLQNMACMEQLHEKLLSPRLRFGLGEKTKNAAFLKANVEARQCFFAFGRSGSGSDI